MQTPKIIVCTKCDKPKGADEFYRKSDGSFRLRCKVCFNQATVEWQKKNKDNIRRYRAKNDSKHSRKEYHKLWLKANRSKAREATAIWRKRNLDHCAEKERHRRAAIKGCNGSGLSKIDLKFLKESSLGICSYCLRKVDKLTVDHVIPISAGGIHALDNCVLACKPCNSKKKDRSMLWVAQNF